MIRVISRRRFTQGSPFLGGYGSTTFRAPGTVRNAQQAAVAQDVIALMDALQANPATTHWSSSSLADLRSPCPPSPSAVTSMAGRYRPYRPLDTM